LPTEIHSLEKLFELFQPESIGKLQADLQDLFGNISDPLFADLLNRTAIVLMQLGGRGNLLEAKHYLDDALKSEIGNFGENASNIAIRRSNLATVFQDLGGRKNLQQAASLLSQALKSDITNFGKNAPSVAISR